MKPLKPVKLTLNGIDFSPLKLIHLEVAIRRFLEKAADGSLFSSAEVARQLGCGQNSVSKLVADLPQYTVQLSATRRIWGNRKTISEARRLLADNNQ